MRDYLPRNQGQLLTWMQAFTSKITATPGEYGLSGQTAVAVSAAVEAYERAHALAVAPATRTMAHVYTKNQARKALVQLVRPLVQQIRANAAVAQPLKVGLGIRLPGCAPAASADPAAGFGRPMLHLVAVQPRRHVLGYGHVDGDGKAKPAGAIGLQLFLHLGDTPPQDPLDARFLRFLSRQPYAVDFKAEQVGQTAFYYARWQTATGETGPWSSVLKMTVAG